MNHTKRLLLSIILLLIVFVIIWVVINVMAQRLEKIVVRPNELKITKITNNMKYSVKKIYEGAESRNKYEAKGVLWEQAVTELDITQSLWQNKGGVIIERTEDSLTVEEPNGEGRIVFKIIEHSEN